VYKATRFTDLVVQRRVRLYADRLTTHHPGDGDAAGGGGGGHGGHGGHGGGGGEPAATEKAWLLDRGCKLEPEAPEEIHRQQRAIRPPGTWTVTAAATARGQPIDLVGAAAPVLAGRAGGAAPRKPARSDPALGTALVAAAVASLRLRRPHGHTAPFATPDPPPPHPLCARAVLPGGALAGELAAHQGLHVVRPLLLDARRGAALARLDRAPALAAAAARPQLRAQRERGRAQHAQHAQPQAVGRGGPGRDAAADGRPAVVGAAALGAAAQAARHGVRLVYRVWLVYGCFGVGFGRRVLSVSPELLVAALLPVGPVPIFLGPVRCSSRNCSLLAQESPVLGSSPAPWAMGQSLGQSTDESGAAPSMRGRGHGAA
jgi:hypothetical protein